MKVDSISVKQNTNYNSRPTFGTIDIGQVETTLKKCLTFDELTELQKVIEKEKNNKLVDLILFSNNKGDKIQYARMCDSMDVRLINYRVKDYGRRWFEKPMNFINRMIEEMEKRKPIVEELLKKQNFEF